MGVSAVSGKAVAIQLQHALVQMDVLVAKHAPDSARSLEKLRRSPCLCRRLFYGSLGLRQDQVVTRQAAGESGSGQRATATLPLLRLPKNVGVPPICTPIVTGVVCAEALSGVAPG